MQTHIAMLNLNNLLKVRINKRVLVDFVFWFILDPAIFSQKRGKTPKYRFHLSRGCMKGKSLEGNEILAHDDLCIV